MRHLILDRPVDAGSVAASLATIPGVRIKFELAPQVRIADLRNALAALGLQIDRAAPGDLLVQRRTRPLHQCSHPGCTSKAPIVGTDGRLWCPTHWMDQPI